MIRIHSFILTICSLIGFTGHYYQFGIARLTPWIPAGIGLLIYVSDLWFRQKPALRNIPIFIIVCFGVLTTIMTIDFLPQDYQPIRKKIIFSIMSASAWTVLFLRFRSTRNVHDKQYHT